MLRKLGVVLAGALLRDPYLQVLAALLVLVISGFATAFVQPYETVWLNVLDVSGLFTLIVTQILSILYFYAVTAQYPFMDPDSLEIVVTVLLCIINAVFMLLCVALYAVVLLDLRAKCAARREVKLKVASPGVTEAAIRAHVARDKSAPPHLWFHPIGIAVSSPPTRDELGVWVWEGDDHNVEASRAEPVLLLPLPDGETLAPGATYCTMHKVTHKLSELTTQLKDVGGCGSANADDGPLAGNGIAGANPALEMVERGLGADADDAAGIVAGVDAGGPASPGAAEEGTGAASAAEADTPSQLEAANTQFEVANAQLEADVAQLEVANAQLEVANAQLEAEAAQLEAANAQFEAEAAQLKAEIARLAAAERQPDPILEEACATEPGSEGGDEAVDADQTALPIGWTAHTNPVGDTYYWNATTGDQQWERPSSSSAGRKRL
jgi:hypothetical protein